MYYMKINLSQNQQIILYHIKMINAIVFYNLFLLFETVVIPYLNTADLTAGGFGKLFYELNDSRVLVGSGCYLNVGLELLFQLIACLIASRKNDSRLNYLSAHRVGNGGNGAFKNRGMSHKSALDLKGTYAVA